MTTNPRRLVAMIEATDKDYTITNFLPDIKITYNAGLDRFEIEEIRDYINIAYAPNISDVTLIVGQNGTGKTSLLRKVFKGTQDTLTRDYLLIFRDQKSWSIRGEKWNIELYQHKIKIKHRFHYHPNNNIIISSASEYSQIASYLPKHSSNHDQTSTGLISKIGDYHSLILQDTTNQIFLLIQQNNDGISYKKLINPMLNLEKKKLHLKLKTNIMYRDREHRIAVTRNVRNSGHYLDYGYKELISSDEFFDQLFDERAYLKYLREQLGIHLSKLAIDSILSSQIFPEQFDFEEFQTKHNENIYRVLGYRDLHLNARDITRYKNSEHEIQSTLRMAYKRCLISILSYSKQSNNVKKQINIDNIIKNPFISYSIKLLARDRASTTKYFYIIQNFYHFANMTNKSLFRELINLSSNIAWQIWLMSFDAVFNYSGTQPHALFDLESEAFQEFLNHLTDDIFMASGSNRTILNNFLHFLTLPVPQVTEHTKLLTQLQSYLTFEWDGLSSGELSLLNQLGRLHAAKQSIKSKHVVLLIDELDLGLHPEWQRRWVRHMLPLIGHIFEDHQVQIIMTTHSPIVLSDIYKDNIIFLKKGPQGQPMVVNNAERQETFGQNIHELFADSFFLGDDSGSVRGDYATNLLNLVIDLLYKKLSHPRDCQQETTNLLQALNLPDDTNEETLKAYLKKIITSTGEPIIAQKLLEMYQEAFSTVEEKIAELEKEIERLRKGASQDD